MPRKPGLMLSRTQALQWLTLQALPGEYLGSVECHSLRQGDYYYWSDLKRLAVAHNASRVVSPWAILTRLQRFRHEDMKPINISDCEGNEKHEDIDDE